MTISILLFSSLSTILSLFMLLYYCCAWKKEKEKDKKEKVKIKLIENLPNHHKDKKEYLLKLKDYIEIPIACIRCRKYGYHVTDCRKEEKAKKEKDKKEKAKMKQDNVKIKPIALIPLTTQERA